MTNDRTERAHWVAFNQIKGIGPLRFRILIDAFGSATAAWNASASELRAAGLDTRTTASVVESRQQIDPDAVLSQADSLDIKVITWLDDEYPRHLLEIYDPPPVLFMQGELVSSDEWSVGVVGTRRATSYGKHVTRTIVTDLVQAGVTIVSGLARGIDGFAHRAALEVGGRTIAVLGSGLANIYPPEHRELAQQIRENGALFSEFPPHTKPEASNFPRRNRIISGLSLGVIVVEAGKRSGALITARYALDQGREVLAVPGNITAKSSQGTNRLIQEGAKPVLHANDVLEELNLSMLDTQVAAQLTIPTTPEEDRLLDLLSGQPVHVDELSLGSGMTVSLVTSTLSMMQLKGLVRQVEGMSYVRDA